MKTIILLHGMGGPNPFNYVESGLQDKFHVLKPVMPGFEKKDGLIEYSDHSYVEYIEQYRKEKHLNSFILIGYSMGGRTAMNYSFSYPNRVEKLILLDAVGTDYMMPILKFNFGKPLMKKILPMLLKYKAVQEMLGKSDFVNTSSKEYQLGIEWISTMLKEKILRNNFVEILTSIGSPIPNIETKLSDLNVPTMLLWAEDDKTAKITSAYWLQDKVTDCELYVLKKYRHMAPLENPEFYVKHIIDFSFK